MIFIMIKLDIKSNDVIREGTIVHFEPDVYFHSVVSNIRSPS